MGDLANPEGLGEVASLEGDMIRLALRVDRDGRIQTARFRAMGSDLLIAATSALIDRITGLGVDEAMDLSWRDLADLLTEGDAGVPESEMHRIPLVLDALGGAVRDYLERQGRPPAMDILVCRCMGVTESVIRAAIAEGGLRTVEQVGAYCDAGLGCSSCHPDIQELLDIYWAKRHNEADDDDDSGPIAGEA